MPSHGHLCTQPWPLISRLHVAPTSPPHVVLVLLAAPGCCHCSLLFTPTGHCGAIPCPPDYFAATLSAWLSSTCTAASSCSSLMPSLLNCWSELLLYKFLGLLKEGNTVIYLHGILLATQGRNEARRTSSAMPSNSTITPHHCNDKPRVMCFPSCNIDLGPSASFTSQSNLCLVDFFPGQCEQGLWGKAIFVILPCYCWYAMVGGFFNNSSLVIQQGWAGSQLPLFRAFSKQNLKRSAHTEKHYVFVLTFWEHIEKMRKLIYFTSKIRQLWAEAK